MARYGAVLTDYFAVSVPCQGDLPVSIVGRYMVMVGMWVVSIG